MCLSHPAFLSGEVWCHFTSLSSFARISSVTLFLAEVMQSLHTPQLFSHLAADTSLHFEVILHLCSLFASLYFRDVVGTLLGLEEIKEDTLDFDCSVSSHLLCSQTCSIQHGPLKVGCWGTLGCRLASLTVLLKYTLTLETLMRDLNRKQMCNLLGKLIITRPALCQSMSHLSSSEVTRSHVSQRETG